LKYWSCWMGR